MTTEAKREAIARAICVALGDDPEREGPFSEWANESPYAVAADAIMALAEPQVSDDTVRVPSIDRTLIVAMEDFINEPRRGRDEHPDVTDYRHEAYRFWEPLCRAMLSAAPASEPQALSEERAREVLAAEWRKTEPSRADFGAHPWPVSIRAVIRFATETQKGSG